MTRTRNSNSKQIEMKGENPSIKIMPPQRFVEKRT